MRHLDRGVASICSPVEMENNDESRANIVLGENAEEKCPIKCPRVNLAMPVSNSLFLASAAADSDPSVVSIRMETFTLS